MLVKSGFIFKLSVC